MSLTGIRRTLRFAREWSRASDPGPGASLPTGGPADRIEMEELHLERGGGRMEATRYRPRGLTSGPGWILLHGMTRTGRRHRNLVRFARAMSASGATVVVPEVPEWVGLDLAPERTEDAVSAGLRGLENDPRVTGPPGLVGFSFGGPQALRVAAKPGFRGRLGSVTSFGGYGEIRPTLDFLLTGRFPWQGAVMSREPDPYGRWVVAANYLTAVPGYEDAAPVAEALRELAVYAGDQGIDSWDARLDPVKDERARTLPAQLRPLFRFFAPPSARDPLPDTDETLEWSRLLAAAGAARDPELALAERVDIPCPVHLVHGRGDALIPVSELRTLARRIQAPRVTVSVTGLFAHSSGHSGRRYPGEKLVESLRLATVLSRILDSV